MALHGLQRLQNQFADIQVVYSTYTYGSWSNRLVEPDEEVRHLADYFLNDLKVTIPVSIWKGRKVRDIDGGMVPESVGPNAKNYPAASKPMIWVLDGKGNVRRVLLGYSREKEVQIERLVQFLRREGTASSLSASSHPTQ